MTECPTCLAAGDPHEAHPVGRRVARDVHSFADAATGVKHHHSSEPTVTLYECNQGHTWDESVVHHCWCNDKTRQFVPVRPGSATGRWEDE